MCHLPNQCSQLRFVSYFLDFQNYPYSPHLRIKQSIHLPPNVRIPIIGSKFKIIESVCLSKREYGTIVMMKLQPLSV